MLVRTLYFLFSIILLATVSSTNARLKIVNNSSIGIIHAKCTGSFPPLSITHDHPINLAWGAVELIMGGLQGSCIFYDGFNIIAGASLIISKGLKAARIADFELYSSKLTVTFTPKVSETSQEISAIVS